MPFRHRAVAILARLYVFLAIVSISVVARADAPPELAKLFPTEIGSLQRAGAVVEQSPVQQPLGRELTRVDFGSMRLIATGVATYRSERGDAVSLMIFKFEDESAAYSRFTEYRKELRQNGELKSADLDKIGTASVISKEGVTFVQGPLLISFLSPDSNQVVELAQSFAKTVGSSEDEIPVLIKHLPQWETTEHDADYAINLKGLQNVIKDQPVLDAVTFDGGTEAVTAKYGSSQLAIVEFTTPQMSIDNDSRIWTKIAELKSQGQPTPTAYRRVGNYSVFVFNAPDEKTANALIDQVKYEQVVQWLGDDPHLYDKLQKYLTQTSAGVLVAVLKSSGLSLIVCLALGGLVGALLFRHRRAQRATAFSDAGGSIRLNLDELTGPANTRPLLPSKTSSQDPTA